MPHLKDNKLTVKLVISSFGNRNNNDSSDMLFKINTKLYIGKNEICSITSKKELFNITNNKFDSFLNSIYHRIPELYSNSRFERTIVKVTNNTSLPLKTKRRKIVGLKSLYSKNMKKHSKIFKLQLYQIDYDVKHNVYSKIMLQINDSDICVVKNNIACEESMDVLKIFKIAGLIPFDIENQKEEDILNMMSLINY